jgi:hypothetical protein
MSGSGASEAGSAARAGATAASVRPITRTLVWQLRPTPGSAATPRRAPTTTVSAPPRLVGPATAATAVLAASILRAGPTGTVRGPRVSRGRPVSSVRQPRSVALLEAEAARHRAPCSSHSASATHHDVDGNRLEPVGLGELREWIRRLSGGWDASAQRTQQQDHPHLVNHEAACSARHRVRSG